MRWLSSIVVFVISVSLQLFGQAAKEFCAVTSVDFPKEIGITASEFRAYTSNVRTGGHLVLLNNTGKSIERILILLSLADENGQHLLALPFFASIDRGARTPFQVIAGTDLRRPLSPGKKIPLSSDVYSSSSRCPKNARAVLVELGFTDGSSFRHAAEQWTIEASLVNATALNLETLSQGLPFEEAAKLMVDAGGHISSVDVSGASKELSEWFRSQLSEWLFAPAMKNGKPVESTVRILFRFHSVFDRRDPTQFDEQMFASGPVMPVDIFPKGGLDKNNQFLLVGGIPFITPK